MGQYYYGVLLDAESKKPVAASYCGKLTESGNSECRFFMNLLHGKRYRVEWAGDYSETKYDERGNMYYYVHELDESLPLWSELIDEPIPGSRYLLNHTKHEAVDAKAFTENLNLLALLCCDPTCRCSGGGDYFFREGFNDVSRWHGDVISASANLPNGFTLIPAEFKDWDNGTPVWEWKNIPEMLMGCEYYTSAGPSASDFTHELLRDGGIFKWACADAEDIRKEFRKWVRLLPFYFNMYKDVDRAKRILKTSRKNIESHLTTIHPYPRNPKYEYKCIRINRTYVVIDEKEGKYELGYGAQAFIDGRSFLCDTKNRREYTKYYERMLKV